MRYFLYISDSKVDMLLPQVPGATRQKVAAKLGFDLKLLSGNIETERSTLDSRVARLEAVEAHIRASEDLGTPAAPSSWIAGSEWSRGTQIGEGAILFVSEDPKWLLALGGSMRHLIGAVSREDLGIPYSFLDTLIDQLKLVAEEDPGYALQLDEKTLSRLMGSGVAQGSRAWASIISHVADSTRGRPLQKIEFIARRLVTQSSFGQRVTLATPLYIALAE